MANATPAFLDVHVAVGAGARPAIVTADATIAYGQLLSIVCRTAHVLRGLGVEPTDRVALLLPDGVAWAAVFFGALRLGAVAVPLNTRLGARAWAAMLADSAARVLVVDPSLLDELAPTLGELSSLRHIVPTHGGAASLESL